MNSSRMKPVKPRGSKHKAIHTNKAGVTATAIKPAILPNMALTVMEPTLPVASSDVIAPLVTANEIVYCPRETLSSGLIVQTVSLLQL